MCIFDIQTIEILIFHWFYVYFLDSDRPCGVYFVDSDRPSGVYFVDSDRPWIGSVDIVVIVVDIVVIVVNIFD